MEENKISKKIRVETSSRVCNLAFEDEVNDRLEKRTRAEYRRRAYEEWIDSIPSKYPGETSDRASYKPENTALDKFIKSLSSDLPDSVERIESNSAGTINIAPEENGRSRIDVEYDESGMLGMDCKTVVTFERESPERITVYRTGTAGASLVFDSSTPRVYCMYDTPAGQIGMGVLTHRIRNTAPELLDGAESAEIVLDYTLELGGVKAEYTHLELKLTVCEE